MSATQRLEKLARSYLPPSAARLAKRVAVWPRAWSQAKACREGYRQYADRYPNPVLFVAGLPKSGTTWLERMLSSFPGYHEFLIPEVAAHELATGGSHDFDLPDDMFSRFDRMLALTKMHVHASPHNLEILKKAGVPYVVLYRDLRDVSVSNFFYMRNTPWHPEHPVYRDRTLEQGLEIFARRTLPAYANWIRDWEQRRDPDKSIELRYEQMLADPRAALARVAAHFELGADEATIDRIVEQHSFGRLAAGRSQGQSDDSSFFRKGIAGDWANHFTPPLRELYKTIIGDFLVEHGYEENLSW